MPAVPGELALAVPGLAGIVGVLLFPTLGAWLKVLLELLEWDRSPFRRRRRLPGLKILRALAFTLLLAFILVAAARAAADLRAVQPGALVVGPSVRGLLVGIALWGIYALGLSVLRADYRRRHAGRGFR